MNQYYAMINGAQVGPMNKCRLAMTGDLKRETQVWSQALNAWVQAAQVPELAELLENELKTPGTKPGKYSVTIRNTALNNTYGNLFIYDDHVTLVPNRGLSVVNGYMSKSGYCAQHYHITEIVGVKKGFLSNRALLLADGTKCKIGTWSKDLFNELSRRRSAYYASRGMAETPLVFA